jgi:hypothetical protein
MLLPIILALINGSRQAHLENNQILRQERWSLRMAFWNLLDLSVTIGTEVGLDFRLTAVKSTPIYINDTSQRNNSLLTTKLGFLQRN